MNENVDWDSLSRYLAGESSEEEKRQINAWLRENPDHYELLNSLRRIWEVSKMPREENAPTPGEKSEDRERLFRAIQSQRDEAPADRTARSRTASVPEQLLAPFRSRLTQTLMAVLLLAGGALLATQIGNGGEASSDAASFQELSTARGERDTVQLDDGTRVWLSVDTKLRIPTSFADGRRTVDLNGEAYFEVAPDADRPFIVTSGTAQVRVLGTKFGVTAYPADSSVQVVVREGSVALEPDANTREGAATLRAGELGRLVTSAHRVTTRAVDADAYLGWLDNKLTFDNTPLPEVARRLERWYDVEVRLEDETLSSRRLTASFDESSPRSVARIIATTLGITYRAEKHKIIFDAR